MKKMFNYKRCGIIVLMFLLVMLMAWILKWPADFDSYVYVDNYKKSAHLHLFIYRFLQYFTFPFVLAIYDKYHLKKRYWESVIENFNLQFITYSLITGLWFLAGMDKYLGVEIFDSSDAFLFITGFVVTTIINKDKPDVLEMK